VETTSGPTYAIQYFAQSKKDYETYIEQFAGDMRKRGADKWADRFIAFRTVMQAV
jgi:DNA gyrase inhibitor GyrI